MFDILIVEDDFSTRSNIAQLLEKSGYNVLAAENGQEAVRLVHNESPDLIISDIMMPEMDGYELFRNVNSEDNEDHIPFIFLSARTELSDFREGMQIGADDYITKPFRAKDLLRSVETRLKKKEKMDKKIQLFKTSITRNISHEFRTPLVPIVGYSQMIRENYWQLGPDEVLEMTGKIQSSGQWMLKLIEKFLLLVELEEITDSGDVYSSSVSEAIWKAVSRIASSTGRGEDILVHIEDTKVRISSSQLERMFTELLDNACRFSNPGSPVEITSSSEVNNFTIIITDYGKGMAPDQVKHISSFLQYSREGMHRAGLGLGLAIVKKIAERNNISLNIESESGKLTRIRITLITN